MKTPPAIIKPLGLNTKDGLRAWISAGMFFFCINLPNLLHYSLQANTLGVAGSALSTLSLLCLPIFLFAKRLRAYFYLLILPLFFVPLALATRWYFQAELNKDILFLMYLSDLQEIWEFLSPALVLVVLTMPGISIVAFFVTRYLPSKISRGPAGMVSIGALLVLLSIPYLRYGGKRYHWHLQNISTHFYPISTFKSAYRLFLQDLPKYEAHHSLTKDFRFGAEAKTPSATRRIFVLMLGESARYDRWQIHGYPRKTSPKLSQRHDILSFSNVAAGAIHTVPAVPFLITRGSPSDTTRHIRERSIVAAYREAGFQTLWLSNQAPMELGGNILSIYAKDADRQQFMALRSRSSQKTEHSKGSYDGDLHIELQSFLNSNQSDVFVVVHTQGSHWRYDARYPDQFDVFKPSGKTVSVTGTSLDKLDVLNNGYDNSILYTDHIINQLIETLEGYEAESFLFYISDHGENLGDDDQGLSLHAVASPATTHIPLLIWMSPQYLRANERTFEYLRSHQSLPVGSQNIFYSLLGMGSIIINEAKFELDFTSPAFVPTEQKVLTPRCSTQSYDTILKRWPNPPCIQ